MKHLHEVALGGVGFGRPVSWAAPERLPRLEMSLLLLLLELPGPLVVVGFLTNLSKIFHHWVPYMQSLLNEDNLHQVKLEKLLLNDNCKLVNCDLCTQ